MNKKVLLILCVVLCSAAVLPMSAGTNKKAKNVLDKTASFLKKAGDIEAQFTATSFKGTQQQGEMTGTLYVHGQAFHLVSDNVIYWYDGQTMWNYVKANNEVNISVPPFYERQAMNPYTFISLYRKGYEYEYGESTLRGTSCYCIHLKSIEKTQKIREMYLDIDKSNYELLCIRFRRGSDGWTRVSLLQFKEHQKFDASKFTFKRSDFPKAELIDLR